MNINMLQVTILYKGNQYTTKMKLNKTQIFKNI